MTEKRWVDDRCFVTPDGECFVSNDGVSFESFGSSVYCADPSISNPPAEFGTFIKRNSKMVSIGITDKVAALVAEINALSDKDRSALAERLNASKVSDMKATAQKTRLDRVLASARNENLKVAFQAALRGLRRVGLEIEKVAASADGLAMVNDAMTKANFSTGERLQLKTVLANIGALD
jgi:hypothetical protein